ncbi:MerR family transcriptional regulator [Paenibacillus donghaensis]|uniref:MerR family transcriptional regulator n=1 Tax=Paenibacillus donghaensis TaxID=414771 RepID=UPI0018843E61|nr:MerR family transcriptional regulator [Paenibacillus donghaensis]MBE9917589.1 MerR family transcriptional regulator [Paenibacillus donghaensis]
MKKPLLSVKDIVRITGVTTRTLQYYDKINLFKPTHFTENGYRLYDRSSIAKLQMILFLKEMDFSLKEIADILQLTKEEQRKFLKRHSQTLLLRKQRLEMMMTALNDYLSGKDLYNISIFDHSSTLSLPAQYENEAKWIYGETEEYQAFERKLQAFTPDERASFNAEFEKNMENVFRKMDSCMHHSPYSDEVQQLVTEWKSNLEQILACDAEMLSCIARTYKGDQRFKNYINQFSSGDLAEFLYQAILHHIQQMNN